MDNDSGGGALLMVVHVTVAWCRNEAVVGMCCSTEGLEGRGGASVG